MQIAQKNRQALTLTTNPLSWWKWWITPRSETREMVFYERNIRAITFFFLVVLVIITAAFVPQGILAGYELLIGIMFVLTIVPMWAVAQGSITLAAWILSATFLFASLSSLLSSGYWAPNAVGLVLVVPVLVALLVRSNWAKLIYVIVTPILYAIVAFYQQSIGFTSIFDSSYSFSTPFGASITFSVMILLLAGGGGYLLLEFYNQQKELKEFAATLEERVAERTRDLNIAAQVSQQVTRELDINRLLPHLANLTKEGFDLAHVSVFVYDNETDILHLQASSGEVGKEMLEIGKQFHLTDKGLVPLAARSFDAQVIDDVMKSADHFANPLLPNTRSEMTVPMRFGTDLIGVIDLQSNEVNHFTSDNINVLTTLAEQIAVAIRNADIYQQAEIARSDAELSNKVKSQFLAAMSHELRTPLNGIMNFTGVVADGMVGPVNEKQEKFLKDAVKNADHLLSLINDVLDISKIESGALKLFVEDGVDVAELCETVARTGETLLKDKPVKLITEIADDLPMITADNRRVRQILLNIVSNACKFTKEGQVAIGARRQDQEILLWITDTGPGIAPEDFAAVFETFHQTETGLRSGGGTGLGMPISRKLAEAHGGCLWIDSDPGQGATFYVTLPIESEELKVQVAQ